MNSVTALCFYLPQYHPTPFNDQQWGPGFTEWTNVAQGSPRFEKHQQPKVPGELGFYDLRNRSTFEEQILLAQSYGIHGFCLYYYRFGKMRELDFPLNSLLSRPKPNFPFCLCWANENWTRAWDGRSDQIIREQVYDEETLAGLVDDLSKAMSDDRYIRINNKPVFIIYQLDYIPEPISEWIYRLKELIWSKIKTEIIIGAVYSHKFTKKMSLFVDFVVQFPPHRFPRKNKRTLLSPDDIKPFLIERGDYFEDYAAVAASCLESLPLIDNLVPGVCPDWDNSARRAKGAHVLVGSTPEQFTQWVSNAAQASLKKAKAGLLMHPLLFVNAWNEWGEGAALEPSWRDKRAYLNAFREGLREAIRA